MLFSKIASRSALYTSNVRNMSLFHLSKLLCHPVLFRTCVFKLLPLHANGCSFVHTLIRYRFSRSICHLSSNFHGRHHGCRSSGVKSANFRGVCRQRRQNGIDGELRRPGGTQVPVDRGQCTEWPSSQLDSATRFAPHEFRDVQRANHCCGPNRAHGSGEKGR